MFKSRQKWGFSIEPFNWSYGLINFKGINVRVLILGPLRLSWG